ncbi:hypothetical protein PanWU01x14_291420 [Parasponia andersonii]|uniref:Zinc-ribbon 15 domain-containing protein n=1 Tax=Parasponia andersonii TaxID=3476 RepID=A0A2P5AX79_PARAD|nr:hypothetical protein PanWU01x14_291420 [Parasponia andersonii]
MIIIEKEGNRPASSSCSLEKPPRNREKIQENRSEKKKVNILFFFGGGGVEQQVRQVLKAGAGRCISCRSPADRVDYDKVLNLFFVPVWRWPGKQLLMHCNNWLLPSVLLSPAALAGRGLPLSSLPLL